MILLAAGVVVMAGALAVYVVAMIGSAAESSRQREQG